MVAAGALVRRSAQRWSLALAVLQFLVLAVGAAAVVGWDRLEVRLHANNADIIRIDAARASVRMVADRPWAGSGLGTWPMVYPRYAGFDAGLYVNQAHNDWLQWAAEGGLPFALLLAIFGLLLWKPAVQSIYGLGTVAFLMHALVDYPMQQRPALGAWFFALAGAAWARQSSRNRNA
jgi:O-antigen ligase